MSKQHFQWPLATASPYSYNLSMLKFLLANVLSRGLADDTKLSLEQSLGLSIGGEHYSFINHRHPTNIEVAELLLQAGVDPNGYCFQGGTPYDFNPALYQAIKNNDVAMTKLLMSYGANPEKDAQVSGWTEEGHPQVQTLSTLTLAKEKGMAEIMVPPEQIKVPESQAVSSDFCERAIETSR